MKAFDLEEAKNGRPVCTGSGRPVRILCFDRKGDYPIVGIVSEEDNGEEYVETYTIDGRMMASEENSGSDLFMATERHEGWINLYSSNGTGHESPSGNSDIIPGNKIYDTREEARLHFAANERLFATVKVEWEE